MIWKKNYSNYKEEVKLTLDSLTIIAILLFIISYGIIITEKLHKTIIALAGASLLVVFGVINQEEAIGYIDFNTIGLLLGMMIIVTIIKQTGLFEYIAIKLAKRAKGNPLKIFISFMVITAVLSAFLDNVTTIIVIVPITLNICRVLGVRPIPFVIAEIFASNVGGTATLIGDPPNIMIGSATHLTFADFIYNLAPVAIITLIVVVWAFKIIYRNELKGNGSEQTVLELDETKAITDQPLLVKCMFVLGLVLMGLFTHGNLHLGFINFDMGLKTATVAMAGAAILLTIGRVDVEKVLDGVEWTTIFFFVGLFILVGGLEARKVLEYLADLTFDVTGGNIFLTGMTILWVSAILSAFVDNIPFVATMIPMINNFQELAHGANVDFLWWCLALGACFGGNGTIIGASANVIGVDILKSEGYKITFKDFFKVAFPMMILTMVIASVYAVVFLWKG